MSAYIGKHLAVVPANPAWHAVLESSLSFHACHLIPTGQGTSSSIRGRGAPILLGNKSIKFSATPGRQLWSWLAPSSAG